MNKTDMYTGFAIFDKDSDGDLHFCESYYDRDIKLPTNVWINEKNYRKLSSDISKSELDWFNKRIGFDIYIDDPNVVQPNALWKDSKKIYFRGNVVEGDPIDDLRCLYAEEIFVPSNDEIIPE